MGLATQFSDSSPKLTTCCGSPAFHSPEIVLALSRPPGEITYWGPELDIWCIALTVLRCWTGKRYPFGTTHKSLDVMRGRVQDLFAWITGELMSRVDEAKREEGRRLREWLWAFVDFDSGRRRGAFDRFDVGDEVRDRLIEFGKDRDCRFSVSRLVFLRRRVDFLVPLSPQLNNALSTTARPSIPCLCIFPLFFHYPTGCLTVTGPNGTLLLQLPPWSSETLPVNLPQKSFLFSKSVFFFFSFQPSL